MTLKLAFDSDKYTINPMPKTEIQYLMKSVGILLKLSQLSQSIFDLKRKSEVLSVHKKNESH